MIHSFLSPHSQGCLGPLAQVQTLPDDKRPICYNRLARVCNQSKWIHLSSDTSKQALLRLERNIR